MWGNEVPRRRVAEDAQSPLSYYPVVVGNAVLLCNQAEVLAVNLSTGKPLWGHQSAVIYQDQLDEAVRMFYNPADSLGAPRFTMTVCHGKAYARMGSSVTSWPREDVKGSRAGYLVCLDLEAEGRLLWKAAPEEDGLAFEGSPVADGARVYVAMRRSDVQPQALVACFDAEDGRLLWRQYVCAAETPTRGMVHETTHNLLALDCDTLYYNTNLGAVAALSTHDGRLNWVSLYPRVLHGDLFKPSPHWSRDLTPCLFDRGRLLVAPADSQCIFAVDAQTGQILWQTGPETEDVVHLLGVAGDTLIASGNKLYWIGLEGQQRGKLQHVWPDGPQRLGYGRGMLAGGQVWWPTRESIYLFDQATGQLRKQIPLVPRGLTGGNLLVAGDRLLIATGSELVALGTQASAPSQERDRMASAAAPGSGGKGTNQPGAIGRRLCFSITKNVVGQGVMLKHDLRMSLPFSFEETPGVPKETTVVESTHLHD
jgi:outer membrane protein assembly factor BamB